MKTVGGGARGRVMGALGRKCQYTKTPKSETKTRLMGDAIDILLGSERLGGLRTGEIWGDTNTSGCGVE